VTHATAHHRSPFHSQDLSRMALANRRWWLSSSLALFAAAHHSAASRMKY